MAKALLCPDCGHRHPLDTVGEGPTFRCGECRRLLKVPAGVVTKPSGNGATRGGDTKVLERPPAAAAAGGAVTTRVKVPPSQRGNAVREQERRLRRGPDVVRGPGVPRFLRLGVWLVAVPVGLAVVLLAGRALGIVDVNDAVDIYIGVGWQRFLAPLLLLPVWAAVSATIAHVMLETAVRMRAPERG